MSFHENFSPCKIVFYVDYKIFYLSNIFFYLLWKFKFSTLKREIFFFSANLISFPEHFSFAIRRSVRSGLTAKQQKLFLLPFTLRLFLLRSSGSLVRLHPLFVTVVAVAFGVGKFDGDTSCEN